jgi:N-acetylmuramic acid 6-phosphate etherase
LLEHLLTEQRNPNSEQIDRVSTLEMVQIIHQEDQACTAAVEKALPQIAAAIDRLTACLEAGGKLFYIGAGTSGRLGVLDASEQIPTFNVPAGTVVGIIAGGPTALSHPTEASEDKPEAGAADLLASGFTPKDAVCGIAASGRTPYVLGAMQAAKNMGALTIGVSCVPQAAVSAAAEIGIEVPTGPEVVTGSTRMKAGTATKMVLNMLTTGTMIRLGYVYSNLMINVQPKNEKLVDRALRIIAEAGQADRDRAALLLEQSGRNVKTAIVMARLGLDRSGAEALLYNHGGRIAKALQSEEKR